MLIGIDAHNLEGKRTGVGRYLINLLQEWSKFNDKDQKTSVKFLLYFKNEVPADTPKSELFKYKLLKVCSTTKFTHWDLPLAAAKDKVDILFCPAYVAPLFYKGKIVLTLHDISYEARPKDFNWPSLADKILLKLVSKKSAQKAVLIFTPSEFSRQEVIRCYGLPPEKIIATPLAADSGFLDKASQSEEIKNKYGLTDKFIFYVGSIFTRRHLEEVIRAYMLLAEEYPNCKFLLAGRDFTPQEAVSKLIDETNKKLNRQAILRVDFIGDEELKFLYNACAFFVWLSDYEGFGLPPLEAMSLGAPVITTNGSSLKEVAGDAALLIEDNGDVKEIYRAMHKIMRDSILREELINKGKAQTEKFSWEKCAAITLEKIKTLN